MGGESSFEDYSNILEMKDLKIGIRKGQKIKKLHSRFGIN